MRVWHVSPFVIDSLNQVGIMRDAVLPQSKTGSNEIARLTTQDGNMHIEYSYDAHTGIQESLRHQICWVLTTALHESVVRATEGDQTRVLPFCIRQVRINLDLRRGMAEGKEEFIAGGVPGGVMAERIPQTSLGSVSARFAKLPISGVPLKDFLHDILTWTTGEDPEKLRETTIYQTDDDIFSDTHEMNRYLFDPDATRTLFSFIGELARAIRTQRSFPC